MTYFTEKQRFTQPWLWALILGLAAVFWYGAVRQLVGGEPWGTNPTGDVSLFLAWLLAGLGFPLLFAWAYNVTGNQGVELTFNAGHRILIGTQDPERFVRAVERSGQLADGGHEGG